MLDLVFENHIVGFPTGRLICNCDSGTFSLFSLLYDNSGLFFFPPQNTCNRKRRDATRVDSFSGTYRIDNLDSQRRGSHFVKRQVSADNGDNAGVSDIDVGGKIKIVEKYSNIRTYMYS